MDVNNDDFYDYHNNNDMSDEDSLLCEGVDHGFDSDVEDEIPDGLPRARTFSLLMGRSNSSEQEEDEEEEEDDDIEEQVVVTKTGHKYEYYDQEDFPTLPDDTAHVSLAPSQVCQRDPKLCQPPGTRDHRCITSDCDQSPLQDWLGQE